MEHRRLGHSGLRVSVLALGTMTFGGRGAFAKVGSGDAAEARRFLDRCLDAGVNLVDTADVYSAGASEEIVGEAIAGRRNQVVLATKARFRMGPGPNDAGASRQHVIAACEASLRRLRVDHIDLYQIHEWDGQTPVEETLHALDTLVRDGKVRYVGCSNFSAWHIMKCLAAAERHNTQRFVSQQIYYSLQSREAEYELVPLTLDQGLGILVWSPLAGGLLSGKYRRGTTAPEGSRHLTDWSEPPVHNEAQLYDVIEVLVQIAESRGGGTTPSQVALAWLLGRPGIASLVIGARTMEQLESNLRAADLVLTAEERARLDDASLPHLPYPYWHQCKTAKDRLSDADLALLAPYIARAPRSNV